MWRNTAGDFMVRIHRQTEQDHLRLGDLIIQRRMASLHHHAHVPDAHIVPRSQQILHGMPHLAIAQNQYALFHSVPRLDRRTIS
jgi:hypothetical protein